MTIGKTNNTSIANKIKNINKSRFQFNIKFGRHLTSSILAGLMVSSLVTTGHALDRLAGKDRFTTAVEISKNINSENRPIVLANARSYVDALSGGSLASASQGRILLVEKDTMPGQTMDEIARNKPSKIYILGGYSSVSLDIENDLKTRGYEIVRISGQDRYETSQKVVD